MGAAACRIGTEPDRTDCTSTIQFHSGIHAMRDSHPLAWCRSAVMRRLTGSRWQANCTRFRKMQRTRRDPGRVDDP